MDRCRKKKPNAKKKGKIHWNIPFRLISQSASLLISFHFRLAHYKLLLLLLLLQNSIAASTMRGAAIQSHGLTCAPRAAVHRPRRAGGHLHLRTDLPRRLSLLPCRARPSSSSSSSSPNVQNSGRGDEDDKLLEDLLQKHGEVVYNAGAALGNEADDDAECLSFAVSLAEAASEVKAADIRVLFVKPLVYWTRFFIILTAFSNAQIDAISSKMRDIGEQRYSKVASGDTKPNSWTLLDFGDVVVHIFLPQQREFYNLEEFYANATSIELPFESRLQ